jgi:1-deoxy-D-xylulose-5-phosphate synthase
VPIKAEPSLLEIGKAELIENFSNNGRRKVVLFPLGNMMRLGLEASVRLKAHGYDVAIVNPRFTKPLDTAMIDFFGRAAELIVTIEDHVVLGGFGSSVLEVLNEKRISTPVIIVGWPDQFIEHATSVDDLRNKYGLTVEDIVGRVRAEFPQRVLPESVVA